MATVHFTSHLLPFVDCPSVEAPEGTLREVLDGVVRQNERLGAYLFDDQRRLRRHVMVFVDGRTVTDRLTLGDQVGPTSEVYVMQALSGG